METAGKWADIFQKKTSRDWLEKDQWESVISAQSLSCTQFFLLAESGVKSADEVASRADK